MDKWISINKVKPPINKTVRLAVIISEIGAPENEGWETEGRLLSSGLFSVKQNSSKIVDFRTPTHWCELSKEERQQ